MGCPLRPSKRLSAGPEFTGLPDEDVLIGATEAGRALVTANIRDFMPIDARYRAASRTHAGLVMVSSKTFPQSRGYVVAVTGALLAADGGVPVRRRGVPRPLPRRLTAPGGAWFSWPPRFRHRAGT